jgi:hypothetical protein
MNTTCVPTLERRVCVYVCLSSAVAVNGYNRGAAMAPGVSAPWPRIRQWSWWITLLIVSLTTIDGVATARRPEATGGGSTSKVKDEAVIEEVTAKQLERVLNEKDFVAVFWCKWSACGRPYTCVVCPCVPSRSSFLLILPCDVGVWLGT